MKEKRRKKSAWAKIEKSINRIDRFLLLSKGLGGTFPGASYNSSHDTKPHKTRLRQGPEKKL